MMMKSSGIYSRHPLLALGLLLMLASACASGPYRSALGELSTDKRLKAQAQSAAYESIPSGSEPYLLSDSEDVTQALLACLSPELKAKLRHDPLLDLIADENAYYDGVRNAHPLPEMIDWAAWRYGRTGVYRKSFTFWADGRNQQLRLGKHLKDNCKSLNADPELAQATLISYGAARINFQWSRYIQSLVFFEHVIDLKPLQKHYAPGDTLVLEGRFLRPAKNVHLFFEKGPRRIKFVALKIKDTGAFRIKLKLPKEPGAYALLINGDEHPSDDETVNKSRWNHTFLSIPIYVEQREAEAPPPEFLVRYVNPKDTNTWAETILRRYNEERVKTGTPPLALSLQASTLAREHASRFVENADTQQFPELEKELSAKGGKVRNTFQFHRRFKNLEAMIEANLRQPSWRYYFLKKELTHIGIGIVPNPVAGGYDYVEYLIAGEQEILLNEETQDETSGQ